MIYWPRQSGLPGEADIHYLTMCTASVHVVVAAGPAAAGSSVRSLTPAAPVLLLPLLMFPVLILRFPQLCSG